MKSGLLQSSVLRRFDKRSVKNNLWTKYQQTGDVNKRPGKDCKPKAHQTDDLQKRPKSETIKSKIAS